MNKKKYIYTFNIIFYIKLSTRCIISKVKLFKEVLSYIMFFRDCEFSYIAPFGRNNCFRVNCHNINYKILYYLVYFKALPLKCIRITIGAFGL